MNVMLFSRIVARSGVGYYLKQLSEELVRQGHNVIVVSSTNDLDIGGETSKVKFVTLDVTSLNPVRIAYSIKVIRKIIRENSIDIVHCHHRMAALYMRIYRLAYRIPMVYTLHLANVPADFLHRTMTYVGDKAIGVSTEVSRFLIENLKVKKDKVITVFNGVDVKQLSPLSAEEDECLRQRWGIKPSRTVFVMHSRIEAVKNHMLVVEAVHLMAEAERKKIQIICSGLQDGAYYENIMKKIDAYGLNENFIFTGWVNAREILGVADTLILTSINEGFPLSVVEAFFMKVPVLCTRTGGFDDQRFCVELEIGNPQQVKQEMLKIVEDKDIYKKRVQDEYLYAVDNFSVEKMAEKMAEIYKDVIDR